MIEVLLNEKAVPHCQRPSQAHFKNKISKDLFIPCNKAILSSAAVEQLFFVGKDVLKPKCAGLTHNISKMY